MPAVVPPDIKRIPDYPGTIYVREMLLVGSVENRDEYVADGRMNPSLAVCGIDLLEVPAAVAPDVKRIPDIRPCLYR